MDMLTVGQVAERITLTQAKRDVAYIARQLRTLIQLGALVPDDYHGSGRTAAAVFDEVGLCRAALLNNLARFGLSPSQLRKASGLLRNQESVDSRPRRRGIENVVQRAKDWERWFFILNMMPWSDSDAEPEDEDLLGGFQLGPRLDMDFLPTHAMIVVDCTLLFRIVLKLPIEAPDPAR